MVFAPIGILYSKKCTLQCSFGGVIKKQIFNFAPLTILYRAEIMQNDNRKEVTKMSVSQEKIELFKKIADYEQNGWWDKDVHDDPPSIELKPNKVDYLNKKLISKIATRIANKKATDFYESLIKNGQFIIKEIKNIENFTSVKGGAIITCNHFHPCDNYAVYRAMLPYLDKRPLYRVIKEGNFTNFPGPLGFFFRHCNTLPLSSNIETMKKFLKAVKTLLDRGDKILIYPEQSLWWNYRKPRPIKPGAFKFAASNNVPVIPFLITTKDSKVLDGDGLPVQEYTIHVLKPIYPKSDLSRSQNVQYLADENYNQWKQTYEKAYGKKLVYGDDDVLKYLDSLLQSDNQSDSDITTTKNSKVASAVAKSSANNKNAKIKSSDKT